MYLLTWRFKEKLVYFNKCFCDVVSHRQHDTIRYSNRVILGGIIVIYEIIINNYVVDKCKSITKIQLLKLALNKKKTIPPVKKFYVEILEKDGIFLDIFSTQHIIL